MVSTYNYGTNLAEASEDYYAFHRDDTKVLNVIEFLDATSSSHECDIGVAFRRETGKVQHIDIVNYKLSYKSNPSCRIQSIRQVTFRRKIRPLLEYILAIQPQHLGFQYAATSGRSLSGSFVCH